MQSLSGGDGPLDHADVREALKLVLQLFVDEIFLLQFLQKSLRVFLGPSSSLASFPPPEGRGETCLSFFPPCLGASRKCICVVSGLRLFSLSPAAPWCFGKNMNI